MYDLFKKKIGLLLYLKSFHGFALPLSYHSGSLLWYACMMLVNISCLLLLLICYHSPKSVPDLITPDNSVFVCIIRIMQAALPSRRLLWIPFSLWFLSPPCLPTHLHHALTTGHCSGWLTCLYPAVSWFREGTRIWTSSVLVLTIGILVYSRYLINLC